MQPTPLRHILWISALLVMWTFYGSTGRGVWWDEEAVLLGYIQALDTATLSTLLTAPLALSGAWLTQYLSSSVLDFVDGARLASTLFSLLALGLTAAAARQLFGPGHAIAAALALTGSFGLMIRAHAQVEELALMAAYAAVLFAIAVSRTRAFAGGLGLSFALTALLLSRGVYDLLAGGLIVLLPLWSDAWRRPLYRQAVSWMLLGLVGIGAATVAFLNSEALAAAWMRWSAWPDNRLALGSVFSRLGWFAWPVWPLAMWALWYEHRRWWRISALLPVLTSLVLLLLLSTFPGSSRDSGLLPVLVPLALLAAYSLNELRRGAAQSLYWFGVLCFGFFAFAFWFYFAAIEWGVFYRTALHVNRLIPGYTPSVNTGAVILAAVTTALWLLAIPLFPRAKSRPVLVWATGMMLIWTLVSSLYQPWVEKGWSYQPLLTKIAAQLPAGACLTAEVGAPMQALLTIEFGARFQASPGRACRYRLVQGKPREALAPADSTLLWQGWRARKRDVVFRLYRLPQPQPAQP